jgi:hypothetical protein
MSDSIYAPYGDKQDGPPLRPEPPRREAVRLDKAAVLQRFRWTDAQFEAAQGYGFPVAAKAFPPGQWGFTLVWRDLDLDDWRARLLGEIKAMQDLVGRR